MVIEKILKAHVVINTTEIAPRTHNLISLTEKAKIELLEQDELLVGILMKYQLQGRYPDYNPEIPAKKIINSYLQQTKNLMVWLQKKL